MVPLRPRKPYGTELFRGSIHFGPRWRKEKREAVVTPFPQPKGDTTIPSITHVVHSPAATYPVLAFTSMVALHYRSAWKPLMNLRFLF